ncbi:hypothetical protein [Silvibacterium sp.]|uniref:hypothetical protein n=1 Tax=Silvibacterium sp. TaxID=1964179 RepID=UPI0039E36816
MDKTEKQISELLDRAGATVLRRKGHIVYRLSDGRRFVRPKTPSDWRASRNALSDLRRLLLEQSPPSIDPIEAHSPDANAPQKALRMKTPNREPREPGVVVFPAGTGGPRAAIAKPAYDRQFCSIFELLDAVDKTESYWGLDISGRVRVLMKLASRFAKLEVIPMRFCRIPHEEFEDTDEGAEKVWERLDVEFGGKWAPSLLLHDRKLGPLHIETSAAGLLGGRDQTIVAKANFRPFHSMIDWPTWKAGTSPHDPWDESVPDGYIYCVFMSTQFTRKVGLPLETSSAWTDAKIIRSAIREILNAHNSA